MAFLSRSSSGRTRRSIRKEDSARPREACASLWSYVSEECANIVSEYGNCQVRSMPITDSSNVAVNNASPSAFTTDAFGISMTRISRYRIHRHARRAEGSLVTSISLLLSPIYRRSKTNIEDSCAMCPVPAYITRASDPQNVQRCSSVPCQAPLHACSLEANCPEGFSRWQLQTHPPCDR